MEPESIVALGDKYWPLAVARELDDAIIHLSFNELELGTWVFRSIGSTDRVAEVDEVLIKH